MAEQSVIRARALARVCVRVCRRALLVGYPEAKKTLDYDALDLQPFYAGADVRFEGGGSRGTGP